MVFNNDYYLKLIKEFNYNPLDFNSINFNLKKIKKEVLEQKWLCHFNADIFADKLNNNEKSVITTGIGLSGSPHMGTLSQIFRIIFLQKNGIDTQMVLGDLDSYNARNQNLDVVKERAEIYKNFILDLGYDETNGVLMSQGNTAQSPTFWT
jgi:tryptophanyl-tRNA synthetase